MRTYTYINMYRYNVCLSGPSAYLGARFLAMNLLLQAPSELLLRLSRLLFDQGQPAR